MPVSPYDFDFELYKLRPEEFRKLFNDEIFLYNSPEKYEEYKKLRFEHPHGILYKKFPKRRMLDIYKIHSPYTEH